MITVDDLRLKVLDRADEAGVTAFTDDELQAFLDDSNNNIALAAGKALTALVADRALLKVWSRDDTKNVDQDRLRRDVAEVARRFYAQGVSEQ